MNPQVEEYLAKVQEQQRKNQEKIAKDKQKKIDQMLIDAGLYTIQNDVEISEEEYYATNGANTRIDYQKDEDGKKRYHYYKKEAKVPLELTSEEYAAVLPTLKGDHARKADDDPEDDAPRKSGSAIFFTTIAWISWIGGFMVALIASIGVADITPFLTVFVPCFVGGCVAMCFAELFNKLQSILNELKDMNLFLRK